MSLSRLLYVVPVISVLSFLPGRASDRAVAVLWAKPDATGEVRVDRVSIRALTAPGGRIDAQKFQASGGRLELALADIPAPGALPALVTITGAPRAFTFRPDDVHKEYPIYLPRDGVVVTEQTDRRSYAEIVAAITARDGASKLERIAAAPEASFASAAVGGRDVKLETWLGLSRDMHLFRVDENLERIQPRLAGYDNKLPEVPTQTATYAFQLGRGWGPRLAVTRSLDDQELPILRGAVDDEDIHYDVTLFASPERSPFTAETLRGTDYLVADAHGHGHMFTPEQAAAEKERHEAEVNPPEEVVLHGRAIATNRGSVPRYALLKTVTPALATPISPRLPTWSFDAKQGFGLYASGRVFAIGRLDGTPLPAEESAILLQPGASVTFEFALPHRPISRERAMALAAQSFDGRLAEARAFWRAKLQAAAQWQLPEPRLQAMARAGRLHLDLITYGREPTGPLLPGIGIYTAIGSESAPIIQYMDSIGRHDTAARMLDFFLEKQHADGFIQNFNGYMLETGAVLWTLGEHYRYTRDDAWLQRVHPHITKACEYLRAWRQRNLAPELKGHGYGLLDGKTADPDDPFRSYMLNGYAYLGFARAAEMLAVSAPAEAAQWRAEAQALRADIRSALADALDRSPVIPLGNGAWTRAAPPWTNYRGPLMLHADGGNWFTHGSMVSRDSLLGPLYLVFQEVVSPEESMATELLESHSELMTRDNVAFSQPYYSRHPWVHLRRGEPKAFLQAWYATVATMADRETFTFNEHYFPASTHKTHEEAWFLMETRWMLYLEEGETLRLLAGAPRAYLAPGATVGVTNAASYFGPLSFKAVVSPDGKTVRATVDCSGPQHPQVVEIRLPHPEGRRPASIEGGRYSAESESVRVDAFSGRAEIILKF